MKIDYSLYLVTDRELMSTACIEDSVELAIQGGCTLVQLREKNISSREFFEVACRVKKITDRYAVPFLINDRVDIVMAVDADGVHIGQSDLPAQAVRKLIGNEKIMGVSACTVEEAEIAVRAGADYLGIGAMFSTATKTDAEIVSFEELLRIRERVNIPLVVIGGIHSGTIPLFPISSVDGFAVVSAIVAQSDIKKAAADIKRLINASAIIK